MTNYFCGTCGTLMNRTSSGYPGFSVLRLGTVDDETLMDVGGQLEPKREQYVENCVGWFAGLGREERKMEL
jgi:hypothetical protein